MFIFYTHRHSLDIALDKEGKKVASFRNFVFTTPDPEVAKVLRKNVGAELWEKVEDVVSKPPLEKEQQKLYASKPDVSSEAPATPEEVAKLNEWQAKDTELRERQKQVVRRGRPPKGVRGMRMSEVQKEGE